MNRFKRLSHAVWECKYHVVWCPKYRFKILRGDIGRSMRDIIRQLCEWKKIEILEGNIQYEFGTQETILGAAFLGKGVLCKHDRPL